MKLLCACLIVLSIVNITLAGKRKPQGKTMISTDSNICYRSNQIVGYADDLNIVGRSLQAVREVFDPLETAARELEYELNLDDDGIKFCEEEGESLIDISGLTVERDTPLTTVLSGGFEFQAPVLPGTAVMLIVEKETPQGKVIAYTFESADICEHVPAEGMPWTILINAMNLDPKDCPLPARVYTLDALKIDLSKASTMLTHENVGDYSARIQFTHSGDGLDIVEHTVACFDVTFSVVEVRKAAEEEEEE